MYVFSDDRTTLYIVEGVSRDIVQDALRLVDLAELPDYLADEKATVLVKDSSAVAKIDDSSTKNEDTNDNADAVINDTSKPDEASTRE